MGKQRAALVLIVLLLILILGWWKLVMILPGTSTETVAPTNIASTTSIDSATALSLPTLIIVHHAVMAGADVYSGSIPNIGTCEQLSSGMSATGQNPAHIILLLTLANTEGCTNTASTTSADFSVSFQSTDTKPAVLNGVSLNGATVAYTLAETK